MKFFLIIFFCFGTLFISNCSSSQNVKLTTYNINVTYLENNSIEGTMTVDYVNNTGENLTFLPFNLYANAYRKDAVYSPIAPHSLNNAYPNGLSYGGIEIKSVTDSTATLQYEIGGTDSNILTVHLNAPLQPKSSSSITIKYVIWLANVKHRLGYFDNAVMLANFYPVVCAYKNGQFYECVYYNIGDPFYSDLADYNVCITVPSQYVVASGGLSCGVEVSGATSYYYTLLSSRDFAFSISKDYNINQFKQRKTLVNYYYFHNDDIDKTANLIADAFSFFTDNFGDYKYKNLTVAECKLTAGGMEYPTYVMVSDELDKATYYYTIVHEIAHQWWYAGAYSNQIETAFIDEGLAEFSCYLFFKQYTDYLNNSDENLKGYTASYKSYFSILNTLDKKIDSSMNRQLKDYTCEYEYVNIAYAKSLIMFAGYYNAVGHKKTIKAMANLYKQNIDSEIYLADIYKQFGLKDYFYSFIDGKVLI